MAETGAEVWRVEIVEEFAEAAKARLQVLGHHVEVRVGAGSRGWPKHQPFDAILVTGAPTPPKALLDQLKAGGRMVLPIGDTERQQLTVIEKAENGALTSTAIMPVTFTQLETAP